VRTDAQGRFEHRGRPGTYTLTLVKPRQTVLRLRAPGTATIERDFTTHHGSAIVSGRIELTLLDASGQPAIVGQVNVHDGGTAPAAGLVRDDASGPFRAEVEPGEYGIYVLPSPKAMGRRMQHLDPTVPFDPNELMRRLRVEVGRVTVVAGQTTVVEARLLGEPPRQPV